MHEYDSGILLLEPSFNALFVIIFLLHIIPIQTLMHFIVQL